MYECLKKENITFQLANLKQLTFIRCETGSSAKPCVLRESSVAATSL
jgi:hypothetical protein